MFTIYNKISRDTNMILVPVYLVKKYVNRIKVSAKAKDYRVME